jgi:hypothetical protein
MTNIIRLLVLGFAISLSACDASQEARYKSAVIEASGYEVLIKYKSRVLECVKTNAQALTCNWAKYNAEVTACKLEKAKQSVVYDKEGNEIVFPPIQGECD